MIYKFNHTSLNLEPSLHLFTLDVSHEKLQGSPAAGFTREEQEQEEEESLLDSRGFSY